MKRIAVDNGEDSTERPRRREILGVWEPLNLALPTDAEWKAMDKELESTMLGAIQHTQPRHELMGIGKGLVRVPTLKELHAMDKEIETEMLDGPVFPPESV
jgi:hypothetical protein